MKKIQIVIGSVRPRRIGEQIGAWLKPITARFSAFSFEIVDLKDWHLPLDDEPEQPSKGGYVNEHTKAWSRKIAEGDGYIFLTPQYNWGYPAALKNALDHLYKEWNAKPALIISYGHRGGVKAAAQLRGVLDGLHMKQTTAMPALIFKDEMLDANRLLANIDADFAPYREDVSKAIAELTEMLA